MNAAVLQTDAATRLALLASFDAGRLEPDAVHAALLADHSIQVETADASSARMLAENARIEALASAIVRHGRPGLKRIRDELTPQFDSALQTMLDAFVRDEPLALDDHTDEQLAAALHVLRWATAALALADQAGERIRPTRDEIEGRIRVRDVERPIDELLAGPVIGRSKELARLNAFRRSIPPVGGLADSPAFVVSGIGGTGKSTLIAMFMRQVIDDSRVESIGWAYLDFDRATLTPREAKLGPGGSGEKSVRGWTSARPWAELVLDDLARQLGAQHPELRGLLNAPRVLQQQNFDNRGLESLGDGDRFDEQAFRLGDAVRGSLPGAPIVVVLDTFEEVERRGPHAAQELYRLFDRLSIELTTLRLIVCGRAPSRPFRAEPDLQLELGEFTQPEARQALSAFVTDGKDLDAVTQGDADRVADIVGRSPLALRLAARVLLAEGLDALTDEQRRVGTLDRIRNEFVRGFLYRRLLDNLVPRDRAVRDTLRDVARASLVLRRISVPVLQAVVLPALQLPANPESAASHFEALRHEVALVEEEDDVLRVRRELRGPALVALTLEDAALVRSVHDLAVDHFAKTGVPAEVVYHRLARGDAITDLRSAMTPDVVDSLRESLGDLSSTTAASVRSVVSEVDRPDSGDAYEQSLWERRVAIAADAQLMRRNPGEARQLLSERKERLEGSELHRLDSRIAEEEGHLDDAIEAQRLDLVASRTARHPSRVAAAGARLAKLLEWCREGREALTVLADVEADPQLAGEWALRLELVLGRLAAAERLGLETDDARWSWGLRARSHLRRLGTSARESPALIRLLAGVIGRDEPRYIRDAVRRIGLDAEAPTMRTWALADAMLRWDRERGGTEGQRGPVADATHLRDHGDGFGENSWRTHLSGLGTSAGSVLGAMWALGCPKDVLEALRAFYLHQGFDPPEQLRPHEKAASAPKEHFLDRVPLDFGDPGMRELQSILLAAYSKIEELQYLAARVGLDLAAIHWQQAAIRVLPELLSQAVTQARVPELMAEILGDIGVASLHVPLREIIGADWLLRHGLERPQP